MSIERWSQRSHVRSEEQSKAGPGYAGGCPQRRPNVLYLIMNFCYWDRRRARLQIGFSAWSASSNSPGASRTAARARALNTDVKVFLLFSPRLGGTY